MPLVSSLAPLYRQAFTGCQSVAVSHLPLIAQLATFRPAHVLPSLRSFHTIAAAMSNPDPRPPGPHLISAKAEGKSSPSSPSSSIIVISPTNRVLLLHRLQKSSTYPSAHVFPGGNLEPDDGHVPASGRERYIDNLAYRTAGIRELFEESGVLLAKEPGNARLLQVSDADRVAGRRAVHSQKISFKKWLRQQSPQAALDVEGLIPFTHWITPPNVPKRFTTQMYVYFIPVSEEGNDSVTSAVADEVETMSAEWRFAGDWTRAAREGQVILFPPQYMLLHLCSEILDVPSPSLEKADIESRREQLKRFILEDGDPTWDKKHITPLGLSFGRSDGRAVLALDRPSPELDGFGLKGDDQRVLLAKFQKEGPRRVEVRWRKDVIEEEMRAREARGGQATERGLEMADIARQREKERKNKM